MVLTDVIDSPCGLRYLFDTLELQSGVARRRLLATEMMTCGERIEAEYERVAHFCRVFLPNAPVVDTLRGKLAGLKYIGGTLDRLKAGAVLDDIELYEIKTLALLGEDIGGLLIAEGVTDPALPDVSTVIATLDPDGLRIPTFFIYDSYSPELAALRCRLRVAEDAPEEVIAESLRLEEVVREELSSVLVSYTDLLRQTQDKLADVDILLAKAMQMTELGLTFPVRSKDGMTRYKGVFHPQTAARLLAEKKRFQRVDIEFGGVPTVIVGANMGGKTVVLKMVALSQFLFQFGFGIPAEQAEIDVKESVWLCIGEEEMSERGLSAFASEIVRIDAIIASARSGSHNLALVDEPARTTNPEEGAALVKALVMQLSTLPSDLILTTHYDLEEIPGRRLRVRGFVDGAMNYELLDAQDDGVPHEALQIAESLGADRAWLESARALVDKKRETL